MLATCVLQHPESLFDDAASMHTMQRELHRSLTSLFRWRCAPCTFQTPPLPYFKTNENFAVLSLSCRELGLLCGALYPPRQYDQNGLGQLARSLGGRGWGGSALTAGANSPLPQIGPSAEDPFTIIIHLLPYNIYGNIRLYTATVNEMPAHCSHPGWSVKLYRVNRRVSASHQLGWSHCHG